MTNLKDATLFFDEKSIVEALKIACKRIGRPLKNKILSPKQLPIFNEKKLKDLDKEDVQKAVDFLIQLFLFYKREEVKKFFHCRPRSTHNLSTGEYYEIINHRRSKFFNHFISLRKNGVYWVIKWGEDEWCLDHLHPEDLTAHINSNGKYQELVVDLQPFLLKTPEKIEEILLRQILVNQKPKKETVVNAKLKEILCHFL